MVNLESALTNGTCPDPQDKQYVFSAPASAVSAFQGAGVTLITEANNHGEDCGPAGLQMALATRAQTGYTILGIGQNAAQAFTPYTTVIHGQHIAIIAATQVIDSDLQTAWTATATQPGLASAYDVNDLVAAVEAARKTADTVIVYLHWGTELDACPNPLQEPLAQVLVQAGADIIVGTHAHVLLGGGYLGSAYVDYGLGNFAFYDNSPPENASGSLVVTVTGRHIDQVTWRPAVIVDDLPQPLSGGAATAALAAWNQARSCTNVSGDARSTRGVRADRDRTGAGDGRADPVDRLGVAATGPQDAAPANEPGQPLDRGDGTDSGSLRNLPRERRRPGVVRTRRQPGGDADPRALSRLHRGRPRLLARGRFAGDRPAGGHARPAGARPLHEDGAPRGLHHRSALSRPRGLFRNRRGGTRSICWGTPWVAGWSWASHWPALTSCIR